MSPLQQKHVIVHHLLPEPKFLQERGIPDFPGHEDLCSADNSISPQGMKLIKRAVSQSDLQILGPMFSHSPMSPHFEYTI
jgi:hypothetical protein